MAIDIRGVEKVHAVDHDALLGRRQPLQHAHAIDDADVLLNHVVAGTASQCNNHPATRPDEDSPGTASARTRSGSTVRADRTWR